MLCVLLSRNTLLSFSRTGLRHLERRAQLPRPASADVTRHRAAGAASFVPQLGFHTSRRLRALPAPLVFLVLKPAQKLVAIILGRSIRKWWAALPPNKRQQFREAAWRRRWHLLAGGAVLSAVMAAFLLTHLDESPVTGRTRVMVFSRESFMELSQLQSDMYLEEFKDSILPQKDPRHQVVEQLITHLAQRNQDVTEMSSITWNVHVVDLPVQNAFIMPDGKVFVFTGLLDVVADIHQLTFILGHEMAHSLIGHAAEQASLSHVLDFLSLILLTAVWALCPRDSVAALGQWLQGKLMQFMFERPFSRRLEAEADQVGLQLAAKACADVRAAPVFWQQLELVEELHGEPPLPEWRSSHPSHQNRAKQLDRLVPQALELRANCMCPTLPEADPRAVFSEAMRHLVEEAREQQRAEKEKKAGQAGLITVPLPALQQTPPAPGPPVPLGVVMGPSPALPQPLTSK
ncbi:metalloendopeptidase OMA1, mitochondrial isoform X1 [Denticeps clupeoides]|uniref:metalloendopeptidase OMA1, mitochondrial isoform X1 n=1 Tax=Denticeps clupeoides TaxID=299321 RepID=UPI0010A2AED5|nr:metalloendopeptidase OMA1, mitochondrial isoform X1 [Denticeps clupeoides]